MIDQQSVERAAERFRPPEGSFERLALRRDRKGRHQRIRAGVLGMAIAIAVGWLGVHAIRSAPPAPAENPTPTPSVWSPVDERGALPVHRGRSWGDPADAPVGWVDVRRVSINDTNVVSWSIGLAAKLPPVADREPGLLIARGLVLDTTADGVADYVVGIDNAPGQVGFHVWVTDLATGETDEQIGPPYGLPIEFGQPLGLTTGLTFLPGSGPAGLNPETVRFYAWASATRDGEVFAWDYAPDAGWMTRT